MDSVRIAARNDSARTGDGLLAGDDSLGVIADSVRTFEMSSSVDTLVTYVAKDSIVYKLSSKKMLLYGSSDIKYGDIAISSARISLNWESAVILAEGIPDTAKGREDRFIGTPVLQEGSEKYEGRTMNYNFRTKKGVITMGQTTIEDGYYLGDRIKRVSPDTYFVGSGQYTTCDAPDHKHYYFGSPKMKVIPNDVIVAEPIVLFIEDIPLFALPFAVIPSKSGRSSGIIIPSFGEDFNRGRYFTGGGYYFAASDYWDATLTGNWYSKGGYMLKAAAQYNLRYHFNGSFSASYGRQQFYVGSPYQADDAPRTDYEFALNHSQVIDPTSNLNADFRFVTSSYYQNYTHNLNQLLNQQVRSSASYSTSWEGTNRSLGVSIERNQDLTNGASTNVLPDIRFNQSQIFPFRRANATGEQAWYELIGFNYQGNAQNTLNISKRQVISPTFDTTTQTDQFDRRGFDHSVSLIISPKLGYISLQPSFSFRERWYDHRIERYYEPTDSTVKGRDVRGFFALHTFQLGVSANTKLYGTITPNVLGILGIRHTVQPSISYSYYPDFSKENWGYYQSYIDSLKRTIRYDPYTGYEYQPGEIFGGIGAGESQTIGMSISNIFEMKVNPAADDTTLTPRKFQLFSLNLSSSYNMVRDSMKLSPISMNFRTNIQSVLDISGGATFSPYVYQRSRSFLDASGRSVQISPGKEVNRYLLSDGSGLARLTSFDFHLSTNLSSDMFASKSVDTSVTERLEKEALDHYQFTFPWNMNLGVDYSMNQYNPESKSRSLSVHGGLSFSPTPHWKLDASTFYDAVTKEFGTPRISVYRDLHCWEMSFNWQPIGVNRYFELVIRLKAPQLKDIKLERKGSDRGIIPQSSSFFQ